MVESRLTALEKAEAVSGPSFRNRQAAAMLRNYNEVLPSPIKFSLRIDFSCDVPGRFVPIDRSVLNIETHCGSSPNSGPTVGTACG